jgi:hypothetical protein
MPNSWYAAVAMVRHQIVMKRAEAELTLTLLDTKLVIHGGDTRLEQEFASTAALVEHALRVVKLRQAEGFRVTAERKDDQVVMPPEPAEAEPAEKAEKPEKPEKAEKAKAP